MSDSATQRFIDAITERDGERLAAVFAEDGTGRGGWPGTHERGVGEAKVRPSGDSTTTTAPVDVLRPKGMDGCHVATDVIVASRASDRAAAGRQLAPGRGFIARSWAREHGEVRSGLARWT